MLEIPSCRLLAFTVYAVIKAVLPVVVLHLFGVEFYVLNPVD